MAGSERVPAKRDAKKPTLPTSGVNEFASDPETRYGEQASALILTRGFRQGFARDIKPDRADLVDRGRINAAQVARDIERGVRIVAIHHLKAQ